MFLFHFLKSNGLVPTTKTFEIEKFLTYIWWQSPYTLGTTPKSNDSNFSRQMLKRMCFYLHDASAGDTTNKSEDIQNNLLENKLPLGSFHILWRTFAEEAYPIALDEVTKNTVSDHTTAHSTVTKKTKFIINCIEFLENPALMQKKPNERLVNKQVLSIVKEYDYALYFQPGSEFKLISLYVARKINGHIQHQPLHDVFYAATLDNHEQPSRRCIFSLFPTQLSVNPYDLFMVFNELQLLDEVLNIGLAPSSIEATAPLVCFQKKNFTVKNISLMSRSLYLIDPMHKNFIAQFLRVAKLCQFFSRYSEIMLPTCQICFGLNADTVRKMSPYDPNVVWIKFLAEILKTSLAVKTPGTLKKALQVCMNNLPDILTITNRNNNIATLKKLAIRLNWLAKKSSQNIQPDAWQKLEESRSEFSLNLLKLKTAVANELNENEKHTPVDLADYLSSKNQPALPKIALSVSSIPKSEKNSVSNQLPPESTKNTNTPNNFFSKKTAYLPACIPAAYFNPMIRPIIK